MALLKPKSLGTSLLSNWILKEPSSSCRNPVTPRSVGTDPGPIWLRLSDDQAQLRLGAFLLLQLSVPAPRAWWLGMPQTVLMVKGAKSESRSCPLLSRGGKSNIGYPGRRAMTSAGIYRLYLQLHFLSSSFRVDCKVAPSYKLVSEPIHIQSDISWDIPFCTNSEHQRRASK